MIFFDFDGVIADSLATCQRACVAAAKRQGLGADLPANPFATLDPLTFEALGEALGGDGHPFARDVTNHVAAGDMPALFDGMAEVLQALTARQPLFVLSANHQSVLVKILEAEGLSACFRAILSGEMPGSKADKLRQHRAGLTGPAVMIGDAASDMQAAAEAGIAGIGVAWGWQSVARLQAAGAVAIAHSPAELPTLIDQSLTGKTP